MHDNYDSFQTERILFHDFLVIDGVSDVCKKTQLDAIFEINVINKMLTNHEHLSTINTKSVNKLTHFEFYVFILC